MKQLDNQTVVSYQSPEVEVIFYNPEASFLAGSIDDARKGDYDYD